MCTRFPWHWHREIEMAFVKKGEVHCLIGNQRIVLNSGEGLFIQSGVIHGYESPRNTEMPAVLFKPDFIAPEHSAIHNKLIAPFLLSNLSHVKLVPGVPWQREILMRLAGLSAILESGSPTAELDVHISVCCIWAALYTHRDEIATLGIIGSSTLAQARLRKMIAYLETNHAGKIGLGDVATNANISKSEALRCFRDGVHSTPICYLNRYRLSLAREKLISTGLSISEIAALAGFSSTSYFDRIFRKNFGVDPTQYRKTHAT